MLIHVGIPSVYLTFTIAERTDDSVSWKHEVTLNLSSSESQNWVWRLQSLQFIDTLPNIDKVNVREIVTQHHALISTLFRWFEGVFKEYYQEEIDKYQTLQREYNMEVEIEKKEERRDAVHQLRESLKLKRCKKTDKRLHK